MRIKDIIKLVFVVFLTAVAVWALVIFAQTGSALREGSEQVENAGEAIGFAFAAIFIALFGIIGGGVSIIASLITMLICSFGVRRQIWVREGNTVVRTDRPVWVRILFWCFLGGNAGMIVANMILFILLGH